MAKELETSLGAPDQGLSIQMGEDGGDTSFKTNDDSSAIDTSELPGDGDAGGSEHPDEQGDPADAPDPDEPEEGDEGEDDGSGPVDLGDFDPDSEESVAAYDTEFLKEDGLLDLEGAVADRYNANIAAGKDGVDEGTYKYLESKGISRETVKQVEAMRANQDKQSGNSEDFKLMEAAGGPDVLGAALAWGKEAGYSKAEQKRFNDISKGKDFEAKRDAVDALVARYNKANPKAGRPTTPRRDATQGQGVRKPALKKFANREEYRKALKAADGNQRQTREITRRRQVSDF